MADFDPLGIFAHFKSLTKFQKIILVLSFLPFILSMVFPSFYIDRKDYDAYGNGFVLFFLGWMGLLIGDLECLIWFANPIYLVALILFMRGNKLSLVLSLIATLIAFSFPKLDHIVSSESGETSKIVSLELGYKLWVLSFLILFFGAIIGLVTPKRKVLFR